MNYGRENTGQGAGYLFFLWLMAVLTSININMANKSSARHVIIIGAGPGGLTAAMILARRGLKVSVFEKENRVGGRNAAIELGPYKFDTGPTFLMLKKILDEVFYEADADVDKLMDMRKLDSMYRLKFKNSQINITSDHAAMKKEIAAVFPGKEKCYDKFLKRESIRFKKLFPCLQKSYHRLRTMGHPDLIKALPHISLGRTLYSVMRSYFSEEELALSFTFQAKYLGMSPWDCPGLFSIIPYIEHEFGIYHPIGGLSGISDQMAQVAEKNGAQIHLNTPVKKIIHENRVAKGVELESGEKISADDVIINADFGYAAENLFDRGTLRKFTAKKMARTKMSCSTFMLYLGVDAMYETPHHMIVFADDYKKNINSIAAGGQLTEDFSFYVRNSTVTDNTVAPDGHCALYVLVPVSNLRGKPDWQKETVGFRETIMNALENRGGFKNLRDHIKEELIITPQNWKNDYNVFEGATFNLAHNLGQMLYLRPRNKFEEIDHCYLAGGGTHPGSGLPTIYESGRIAANLICRSYNMEFETHNLEA